MAVQPIRKGFSAITPYLFAEGAAGLVDYLGAAFGATELMREEKPDGAVIHAELRIGDAMVMVGESSSEWPAMPTSIYLYVTDCDAVYERALEAGGASVFPMMDLPSGERYGGVKDPYGNIWWVATHVEDVSPEEQARRWKEFRG
jgi:uncharacterized glyoxalase superfamily protein PhnB